MNNLLRLHKNGMNGCFNRIANFQDYFKIEMYILEKFINILCFCINKVYAF